MMDGVRGSSVVVKRNAKVIKRRLDHIVIVINEFFWRFPFSFCSNGNRHSVLITSTDKKHILSFHAQVAGINVCWNINTSEMSDMYRTIGVRKCCGNRVAVF